jgi:hypothetical protein
MISYIIHARTPTTKLHHFNWLCHFESDTQPTLVVTPQWFRAEDFVSRADIFPHRTITVQPITYALTYKPLKFVANEEIMPTPSRLRAPQRMKTLFHIANEGTLIRLSYHGLRNSADYELSTRLTARASWHLPISAQDEPPIAKALSPTENIVTPRPEHFEHSVWAQCAHCIGHHFSR